ncbi:MAG: right-handed parallel beta-helix repeat-containing protein, partial [Clostridia bacterium]|nr:right-handed parallel beta-helix repeat-containing protein [Clostridia bacterium]
MSDIYYCTPSGGKTLEDALNAVREARRNGYENPLTISILEDIYLDAPITLDLSLGNLTLTSPNKSKIIGGIPLDDWKRDCFHGTECISTQIPTDREGNTPFPTDLFIEGKRANATRYPKTGTLRAVRTGLDAPFDNSYLALLRGTTDWFVAFPEDLAAAGDISGAMVNYYHYWLDEHSPIRSFDLATGRIDMTYRSRFALTAYYDEGDNAAMHYYFTGVSGTFHEAGEWYADRKTNTIYYISENNGEPTSLIGYIPTLAHLFYITGENIHIENLELLATRSDYASTMCLDDITKEYVPGANLYGSDIQSVCWASGAVIFEGAKNASVTNCYLHALGVHAIDIREGCENIRIEQNHIEDIAAGGIRVFGGAYGCERERITSHITIRKNEIAYCGKRYEAGCGILVCHASYNEISENEVHDIGYTGISVGWVWGYGDSSTHHNLIANN